MMDILFKQNRQQSLGLNMTQNVQSCLYKTLLRSQTFHRPMLDPRDHRMLINYEDVIEKYDASFGQQFSITLRTWLVKVYQAVSSDSFMKYLKKELTENQMKAYFTKNILLNICFLIKDLALNSKSQFQMQLVQFINSESKLILGGLLLKYPQVTNPSDHLKLKSAISRYDNRENEEFDILRNPHKFGIKYQIKENSDYSTEIMHILNYIMKLPNGDVQINESLSKNREKYTFMEIFKVTFQGICMFAGNEILQNFGLTFNTFIAKQDEKTGVQFFDVLQGKSFSDFEDSQNQQNAIKSCFKRVFFQLGGKIQSQMFETFTKKVQKQLQANEQNKNFELKIGQKIPPNLKYFTQQEIQAGAFRVCDASVLRVMTKWAQQLRDKIKKARSQIYKRVEMFKNTQGDLIQVSTEFKQIMLTVAEEKQKHMKKVFKQLSDNCLMIQKILANQYRKSKYINDIDGNIGSFAAKIQACIGQYLFQYLNQLFHALLQIPKESAKIYQQKFQGRQRQAQKYSNINLISFKIGDLFRGKFKSSQKNVIKVYKFLQKISQKTPKLLKIVRVKDRLDEKDSDILVNLFYMNRVQCQLQLAVKSNQIAKQNQYNAFNHLIYQLKRADFGPIAECASILSKYDYIVKSYAKNPLLQANFVEPSLKCNPIIQKVIKSNKELRQFQDKDHELAVIRQPFICDICGKFKIINNPNFFKRRIFRESFKQCNDCYFQRMIKQSQQTRRQVYKDLFAYFATSKNQMSMILKHVYINDIQNMKDIESFFKQAKKGFIIFKNQKIPKPKFYQLVKFEDQINILVQQDRFSNKQSQQAGKIIESISIHSYSKEWKSKLQQKAYFLTFKQTENCPIKNIGFINQLFLASKQTQKQKQSPQDNLINLSLVKIRKIKNLFGQQMSNFGAKQSKNSEKPQQKYNSIKCQCCSQKQIIIGKQIDSQKQAIKLKNLNAIQNVRKKRKQTLFLASRKINNMLEKVKPLVDVKRCYLSDNQIQQINFPCLRNVKYLNLDNNAIVALEGIQKLANLEVFLCNANSLGTLQGIQNCQKIQVLEVNQNFIQSIYQVSKLPNIRHFQCAFNRLYDIQPLKRCTTIKTLKISNNKVLFAYPLNSLDKLENLLCQNNKIEQLDLSNCEFLQQLNCSGNFLRQIVLYNNKVIRNVNCERNQITSLKGLEHCHSLQCLQCSQNDIQNFKGIQNLCKLKTLVCCNNRIKSFNGLQNCLSLEKLNCGNNIINQDHWKRNKFNSLASLLNCKNLKDLYCQKAGLQTLDGIENFENLQVLKAAGNNIREIQKLQQLQGLRKVDLTGNMLDFKEQQRLQRILIKNKQLVSLFYLDFSKDSRFNLADAIINIQAFSLFKT